MIFDPKTAPEDAFYFLMIQAIIPRPIAWVLSKNPNNTLNLAPFSFFNGVTSEPPILMISVGWKDDTTRKDTWVNIDERTHFVVHIPPLEMGPTMVATSAALPLNKSEVEHEKLKTIPIEGWPLPRLDGPKTAFLCEKHKILEIGDEKQGVILGEIKKMWVDDAALSQENGKTVLDPKKLNPISRLGGKSYSQLDTIFQISRPK